MLILTANNEIINKDGLSLLTGQEVAAIVLTPKDFTDLKKTSEYLEANVFHRMSNPSNSDELLSLLEDTLHKYLSHDLQANV